MYQNIADVILREGDKLNVTFTGYIEGATIIFSNPLVRLSTLIFMGLGTISFILFLAQNESQNIRKESRSEEND